MPTCTCAYLLLLPTTTTYYYLCVPTPCASCLACAMPSHYTSLPLAPDILPGSTENQNEKKKKKKHGALLTRMQASCRTSSTSIQLMNVWKSVKMLLSAASKIASSQRFLIVLGVRPVRVSLVIFSSPMPKPIQESIRLPSNHPQKRLNRWICAFGSTKQS